MTRQATVLGAGITGLTTALVAAKAGWTIRVLGAKLLPGRLDRDYDPTFPSLHPAAFLKPLLCDYDPKLWALSFAHFHQLAEFPETGVSATEHWELYEDPHAAPSISPTPWTSPSGGRLYGRAEKGLLADLPVYLTWLMGQLESHGVALHEQRLMRLTDAIAPGDEALFHCAGLGAGGLAADPAVSPIGGQLLRVKYDAAVPAASVIGQSYHCHPRDTNITIYSYPRHNRLILGGSQLHLAPDADTSACFEALDSYELMFSWNTHLLRDMYGVDLAGSTYAYTVGMRPYREGGVRIERDDTSASVPVIHNYGHGGGGVSLSWGCAQHAEKLANS